MTAAEFKDAIRPFVKTYMDNQKVLRNGNIFRIDTQAKSQTSNVVNSLYREMAQIQHIENEVYS